MRKLLIASVLVCGGVVGAVTGAHATQADADAVALCVGCTTASQFETAAMQALGTRFNGTRRVLVVNPDTALSKWVMVTNTPTGQNPLSAPSSTPVRTGVPFTLEARPFADIFIAGSGQASTNIPGSETAQSSPVTQAQQLGVQTIKQLTEKTVVVTLNPSVFPSYERSEPTMLANANFAALQAATNGRWPVTSFTNRVWTLLLKVFKEYVGQSLKVCDVFSNGDSVCAVPDPFNNDILVLAGPGQNAIPENLPDIAERAAGGGGEGMVVRHDQGANLLEFGVPGSTGATGEKWLVCSFEGGKLISCYVETVPW